MTSIGCEGTLVAVRVSSRRGMPYLGRWRQKMPQRAMIRTAVVVGLVLAVAVAAYQAVTWNSPGRKFQRAIAVEHSNDSSDEFGDYGHILVGRIKDVPIEELAAILKLPSHTTRPFRDIAPDAPGWQLFPQLGWWKLPDEFDEIYYELSSGSQCLLGRRGDRIFLQDLTW